MGAFIKPRRSARFPPGSEPIQGQQLNFVPLAGERDEEHQFGVTIPFRAGSWTPTTFSLAPPTFSTTML